MFDAHPPLYSADQRIQQEGRKPRAFSIHKTLRTTPAMAANITKRFWEIGDIVDVLEAWETAN
jgi:hypothetical protein